MHNQRRQLQVSLDRGVQIPSSWIDFHRPLFRDDGQMFQTPALVRGVIALGQVPDQDMLGPQGHHIALAGHNMRFVALLWAEQHRRDRSSQLGFFRDKQPHGDLSYPSRVIVCRRLALTSEDYDASRVVRGQTFIPAGTIRLLGVDPIRVCSNTLITNWPAGTTHLF